MLVSLVPSLGWWESIVVSSDEESPVLPAREGGGQRVFLAIASFQVTSVQNNWGGVF